MESSRSNTLIFAIFLMIAILLVYWPVQDFGFLSYDDPVYVTSNHQVQKGLTMESIRWAFIATDAGFWHPLTWVSLMLDYEIYHLNPSGYHWTNLILHMISTILLFACLKTMTGAVGKSAFVAALFALHPLHVESVAWVAERKDVLSGFFCMLTINAYVYYLEKNSICRYILVFVCFVLGLMAKPMLVTLPFVLLLLDVWPLNRLSPIACQPDVGSNHLYGLLKKNYTLVVEKFPLLLVSIVVSVTTYHTEKKFQALAEPGALTFYDRMTTAAVSSVSYLWKMLWPQNLAAFYPHPGSWPLFPVIISVAILTAITFFVLHYFRKMPYLLVGWFWYLIMLCPVSGIIQVGSHAMADRYTYIPLIGIFIMIAWGAPEVVDVRRYNRVFLFSGYVVIICILTSLSSIQVKYWRDDGRLFRHALAVTNDNYLAHSGLGTFLINEGKYHEGIIHLRQAIAIRPDYDPARFKIGIILSNQGKYEDAIFHFRTIVQNSPDHIGARRQLAHNLLLAGRPDETIKALQTLIQYSSGDVETYNQLGIVLMKKERFPEAEEMYRKALEIKADHAGVHNNLAMLLMNVGRYQEAINSFKVALELQPDYANAHYYLARNLEKLGRTEESKRHYKEAIRINPDYGKK